MSARNSGCPCENEKPDPCPRCGASVSGDDKVGGICQADKLDAVVVTDAMVSRALDAWFASPPSETDQGLERSMRDAIEAAVRGLAMSEAIPDAPSTQDAKALYDAIQKLSEGGKRSVTIPNGDVPTLLRCLHLLKVRDRQMQFAKRAWLRAAKSALAGDPRELRNRVDLAESPPVEWVLSGNGQSQDR